MTNEQSCILLVESDLLVRHPLAEYLRECGYRVLEASQAAEARQLLENAAPRVDIVLADAAGASVATFALAGWMRTNHPETEIIMAGTVEKATQKAGDLCEDGPALTKPYDHKIILSRIRRQLEARKRDT